MRAAARAVPADVPLDRDLLLRSASTRSTTRRPTSSSPAAFGLVGYWLIKHDFEPAPLLLGMVLGPLMEENLRRALLIARGDWTVFVTRPLSAVLLAMAAAAAGAGGAAVAAQEARRGVRGDPRRLKRRPIVRLMNSRAGTQVPPLCVCGRIIIFPGIIAASGRIGAVDWPAPAAKFALP